MNVKKKLGLVVAMTLFAGSLMTGMALAHPVCDSGWQFDITSHKVNQITTGSAGQSAETFSNYNGSSSSNTNTFTATTSTTVGESLSTGISAGSGAALSMFYSVQVHITSSITHSRTDGVGNAASVTTPAHQYGNGRYGSWRVWVVGNSYYITSNCGIQSERDGLTYKVPMNAAGWCVWNSTLPASNPPSQCQG